MTALYVAAWILCGLIAAVAFHWIARRDTPDIVWFMSVVLVAGGPLSIVVALIMVSLNSLIDRGIPHIRIRNPFYKERP